MGLPGFGRLLSRGMDGMDVPKEQASRLQRCQVGALLALPLILLCLDPNWIFPTLIHDPWIYLGYAIDPWRMLTAFAGMYYGDRLTMILPAALFHGLVGLVLRLQAPDLETRLGWAPF